MRFKFIIPFVGLLVLIGAGCASAPPPSASSVATTTKTDEPPRDYLDEAAVFIEVSEKGFFPDHAVIHKGEKVEFKNTGNVEVWPASDPHPVHTDYSKFDPHRGLKSGETFEIDFPEIKTYRFHDHLNPVHRGVIEVK